VSPTDDELPGGSWLVFYGEELREARELKGMSVRELASHTSYSYQQVSNVETARRTPSLAFSREVDAALETNGRFQRILRRVLEEPYPDWFKGAAKEEQRASRIRVYTSQVIHGLLQTEDYARQLMLWSRPRTPVERLDVEVAGRLQRQEILTRDNAPFVWAILDESVLLRPIGGPKVMAKQLERLLDVAEYSNVVLQVVRLRTPRHPGLDGPFTIWGYEDGEDVMYAEGMLSGRIIEKREDMTAATLAASPASYPSVTARTRTAPPWSSRPAPGPPSSRPSARTSSPRSEPPGWAHGEMTHIPSAEYADACHFI
jgi:transcriptional regulator with XRE-family HTH domain